jgi:hypothetical protein
MDDIRCSGVIMGMLKDTRIGPTPPCFDRFNMTAFFIIFHQGRSTEYPDVFTMQIRYSSLGTAANLRILY